MTALPEPATVPAVDPFSQGLRRDHVLLLLAGDTRAPGWRAAYACYLRSPHWQAKKAEAFSLFGHACMLCSSPIGLQVHHRGREAYRWLFREVPARHLTVLCSGCHEHFHKGR